MAIKNFVGNNAGMPLGFNRGNPMPLDNSSIWATLDEAKEYAKNGPVAYVGQILAVLEGDASKAYIIADEAGTLKEVGSATAGDNNSIVLDEGILKLFGFDNAATGAQLTKGADGKLSWILPDTTTVEGLNTTVNSHTASIKTLSDDVTILKGNKTTEGSVAYQIAEIVGNADENYDTLVEIADWIKSDSTGAAKMANDINDLTNKIGKTSVNDQIVAALQSEGKDKYALAANLETTDSKVKTNEDDIKSILGLLGKTEDSDAISVQDAITSALTDGESNKYALAQHTHAIADIINLQETLNNKADTTTTDDLASRLEQIENKANKEVIDAITQDKVDSWNSAIKTINVNGTALDIANNAVNIAVPVADNTSIESNDGTFAVKAVHISKVYMNDEDELILNGGKA